MTGTVLDPEEKPAAGVRVTVTSAEKPDFTATAESDTQALVRPASPLSTGDSVVTRGNERLRPEQPLEVLE